MNWIQKLNELFQPEVLVICLGILLVGFLAWWFWARRYLPRAKRDLEQLAVALEGCQQAGDSDAAVARVLRHDHWLQGAWKASKRRVIEVGPVAGKRRVLLGNVSDLWQPERLLHKRFNFALFEAVPNIAVGVGLFFTFLFLTLALTNATATLAGAGTANPVEATKDLLGSAGGKFLSSLAGLFVSLVWTLLGRRAMAELERAAERVVEAIESHWPPVGAEMAVLEQLNQLQQISVSLIQQHDAHKEQQALAEDILTEEREQTGVLKRFETDLALSIGKAVTSGFGPQMDEMTGRLERAIAELSNRMGTMNEDALRVMMNEFSQTLRSNTAGEMEQFRNTLSALATNLEASGASLQNGVGTAAAQLGAATQGMTENIEKAASHLVTSVNGMDSVVQNATKAVDRVDEVIGRATDLGARGIDRLNQSINSASALVDRVGEASSGWMQVTKELQALGARLAESCDGMEELAQEQRAVIGTVRAVGPEVLASVTQIREQMEGTTRSVAQAMNQVQSSMGRATDDLSGVVVSIREGITEYTRQLAALHTSMDAEMSKAVGKLGGAIQNLDETLGELTENLAEFDRKK